VSSELERSGTLDESGGAGFIRSLAESISGPENAEAYASAVKNASVARAVLAATVEVQDLVRSGKTSPDELLGTMESSLTRINEQAKKTDFRYIKNVLFDRYKDIGNGALEEGLPTGFDSLDNIIGGLVGGRLYVLAARPGVGKSSAAITIAKNVSLQGKGSVLVYSLEMTEDEISDRIISSTAAVSSSSLRTNTMNADEYGRVFRAIGQVENADLFIDDDGSLTLTELRAKARRFTATHKVALIVVDYLQLMTLDGRNVDNRQLEVSSISRKLKALAKELDVPALVLSQLNRDVESRKDKRPQLSDLRESGAIEQDADVVGFLFFDPDDQTKTLATLAIEKNRQGPRGEVQLVFTPEFTRFREMTATPTD